MNSSMTALSANRHRAAWLMLALVLISLTLIAVGAAVGSTGFESLLHLSDDPVARQIVTEIRLPRTVGAWLAGGLLGLAGAIAQGLFRNPLADPYLLGSASGATLGGAMASSYVAGNEDKLSGLILLGAYPVNDSPINTLCIYGSEDIMLDKSKLAGVSNVLRIEGGNHAQFGNYGVQEGDGVASISREAQQEQAAGAMLAFLLPDQ